MKTRYVFFLVFCLILSISCGFPVALSRSEQPEDTILGTESPATAAFEPTPSPTSQPSNAPAPSVTPTLQPTPMGNIEPYYLKLSYPRDGKGLRISLNTNSYNVVKELYELPPYSGATSLTTDMVLSPQRDQVLLRVCENYDLCDVYILALDGTAQRKLTHQVNWDPHLPQWYPDGTQLFFWQWPDARVPGSYLVIQLADDSIRRQTLKVDDYASLSPDGTHILYTYDQYLNLVGEDGSGEIRLVPNRGVTEREWLPDGSGVVFDEWSNGVKGARLQIVNLDTRKTITIAEGIEAFHENFTFSPDRKYMVYTSKKVTTSTDTSLDWLIWIAPVDGSQTPLRLGYCTDDNGFRFSPDGTFVLFSGYPLETGPVGDAKPYAIRLDGSGLAALEDTMLLASDRSLIRFSTTAP